FRPAPTSPQGQEPPAGGSAPASDAGKAAPAPADAARALVREFVAATAAGDYAKAYGLYAAGNRWQTLASFEQIAQRYAERFRVASMNLGAQEPAPGTVHLIGTFTLESGAVLPATFTVVYEDGAWRMGPWQIGY